jgi:hypothetical protein
VAEVWFNEIDVDGYFLEYDSERAGGFHPLRLLPKGKVAVLGVISTKSAELESVDFLNAGSKKRRNTRRSSNMRSVHSAALQARSAAGRRVKSGRRKSWRISSKWLAAFDVEKCHAFVADKEKATQAVEKCAGNEGGNMTTKATDVLEFIDSHPVSRYQIDVLILWMLVSALHGFDTQAIGYTAPAMAEVLKLPMSQFGQIGSAGLIGAVAGAFYLDLWPI